MSRFGIDDMMRFSEAVLRIHHTRNAGDFSANILRAMRKIMAVDVCVVDWYGFQGLDVRTIYDPINAVPQQVNEALHQFGHQSPIYGKWGDAVKAISDTLSRVAWHRTDLYAEGFKPVDQDDCIMLNITLRKDCRVSLITSRGKRGFAMEERAMLAMLEPHVRQVFDRLQVQNRMEKALAIEPEQKGIGTMLSPREREVLEWLARGKTNGEIALLLDIRTATVKKHLEKLYTKLGVENRHAAALLALRLGQNLENAEFASIK